MMRYWECKCCASLIVTNPQDSAEEYQCPQCLAMSCERGKYVEVSREYFAESAELPHELTSQQPPSPFQTI